MTRVIPLLGWLVLVLAMGVALSRSQAPTENDSGEREIYYALSDGQHLSIRVPTNTPWIRILAHLETGDPGTLDESTTWIYGLRMHLQPANGQPSDREHWTRSRQTFLPDGSPIMGGNRASTVVSDSRIIELDTAHLMPQGGMLRVEPLLEQPEQRLLLRIFQERIAQPLERLLVFNTPEKRKERIHGIYPFGWYQLTSMERFRITNWARDRLSAEELTGTTVPLRRLGTPSPVRTTHESSFRLASGEGTVINLHGPCTLHVSSQLESPPPSEKGKRIPLRLELVDASPSPVTPAIEPEDLDPYQVDVPQGATWSLRLMNAWENPPLLVNFSLEPTAGHSWGEPPGAAGEQPLAPERRRLTVYHIAQDLQPITVPVATGDPWGVLAIEARPRTSPEWLADPTSDDPELNPPTTITFTAFDDSGRQIGVGHFQVPFEYSPFERYVNQPRPEMSRETRRHIFHDYRASIISFSADRPVDIRFLVPLEVEPVQAAKYDTGQDWMARYAPWELAPYITITPYNVDQLVEENRLVQFDATVRIQRRPSGGSEAYRSTELLEPLGSPPRYPLVERFQFPDSPWKPWHRTLMEPELSLEIPAGGSLDLDYRVPTESVGQTAFLRCGATERGALIIASGGTMRFDLLKPGTQDCHFNAPTGEYLAAAPGSGQRWVRRTVYRADQQSLKVLLNTIDRNPLYVIVRAYTPTWTPAPSLEIHVDGGKPRRGVVLSTSLTRGSRSLKLVPNGRTARMEDQEQGTMARYKGVVLLLGDDLEPGPHVISVRTLWEKDEPVFPVFLRFEATSAPTRPQAPKNWAMGSHCLIPEDPS